MDADSITVAGITFTERDGRYRAVWYAPQHVLKLQTGPRHPNKVNDLVQEAEVLKTLTRKGLSCVPKFHESGRLEDGRPYLIMQRLLGNDERPRRSEVMRSFQAVMRCGYLHGDLKRENIIWDGQTAYLIDFDQTVHNEAFSTMPLEEAYAWSEARQHQQPWKNCHPLRIQLGCELLKFTIPD